MELVLGPAEAVVVSSEAEEVHLEAVQREVELIGVELTFPGLELEHLEEVLVLQEEAEAELEFMLSTRRGRDHSPCRDGSVTLS